MKRQWYYRGSLKSCNYSCSYCPFSKKKGSVKELQEDKKALFCFVERIEQTNTISGAVQIVPYGEALIHSYYWEAFAKLSQNERLDAIGAQSNFSFPIKQMLEVYRRNGGRKEKLRLWGTFHPEMTTVERFVEQCNLLLEEKIKFSVGVVGVPANLGLIQKLRSLLPESIYLWINKMDGLKRNYTKEEIDAFLEVDEYFEMELKHHKADVSLCERNRFVEADGTMQRCNICPQKVGNFYKDRIEDDREDGEFLDIKEERVVWDGFELKGKYQEWKSYGDFKLKVEELERKVHGDSELKVEELERKVHGDSELKVEERERAIWGNSSLEIEKKENQEKLEKLEIVEILKKQEKSIKPQLCARKECSCFLSYCNQEPEELLFFQPYPAFRIPSYPKAVFFDIDGTLIPTGEKQIPKEYVRGLYRLAKHSKIYLATSLPYEIARQRTREIWDIVHGGVFANGGRCLLRKYKEGEKNWEVVETIEDSWIEKAKEKSLENGYTLHTYRKGKMIYKVTLVFFDKVKIEEENYQKRLVAELGIPETCQFLLEENCFQITKKGTGKLEGVLKICEQMGYEEADVMVAGDSENDIPMLQYFSHAVVPKGSKNYH